MDKAARKQLEKQALERAPTGHKTKAAKAAETRLNYPMIVPETEPVHANGHGNPRKLFPDSPEAYDLIERMARDGVPVSMLCIPFCVSLPTWERWLPRHPGIQEAVRRGRMSNFKEAMGVIKGHVAKDNLTAAMFVLNNVHGLDGRARPHIHINATGGNVSINLPAAAPSEDAYRDAIEGEVVNER